MGKTDGSLNIIGQRMDDDPAPGIYVGPSKSFVEDQMEPRLKDMINSAASLSAKLARGKREKKTRKQISGVDLRLAWAGSATELASFPAAFALIDERDRMDANIKGEGDPVGLVEARGDTYIDFTMGIFSTPLVGNVEEVWDDHSKIFRWQVEEPGQIQSPIWKLWQEGTRHEWAWRCPHCNLYFVPRFNLLKWPKGATAEEARKNSWLVCHHCGGVIEDKHKIELNASALAIAPGQKVVRGKLQGNAPDNSAYSLWVSGICSPWRTFGQRAHRFLTAVASGDQERIQTAINTGFGELFKMAGDQLIPWSKVAELKEPYKYRQVPKEVIKITCAVDVQSDRLIYSVRGWGVGWESWLLAADNLWGDTRLDDVWDDLAEVIRIGVDGRMFDLVLVDSGYRPGKPVTLPTNKIYEFCRKHRGRVRATKGRAKMDKPFKMSKIDITLSGRLLRSGLELWHLDTDYFKSWVQLRLNIPEDAAGRWHISEDANDEYCKALVSESRVVKPSGAVTWIRQNKENHYLDTESMNVAAAHMLGAHKFTEPTSTEKKSVGYKLAEMNR